MRELIGLLSNGSAMNREQKTSAQRDQHGLLLPRYLVLARRSGGVQISETEVERVLEKAGIDCTVLKVSGVGDAPEEGQPSAETMARPIAGTLIQLSVVIPVCNEEANLPELHSRLTATMGHLEEPYELIYVDDGSQDKSLDVLKDLWALDGDHTRIVRLSRNFGHQQAISAGLDYARGQAVIVMDADLQDPPEVIPIFVKKWRQGYQVVYAIREKRKERLIKRALYRLFYLILRTISRVDMPLDAGDFGLMDRHVVDVIRSLPERNRFVRGLRSWVGFRRVGVPYSREARSAGRSQYTFRKLVGLALDGLVSFSHFPLRLATLMGFGVSALSSLLGAYYLVRKLVRGIGLPGFATVVILMAFLGGVQLLTVGIIGEYVGHVLDEVKHRPAYIVHEAIGFGPTELPTSGDR